MKDRELRECLGIVFEDCGETIRKSTIDKTKVSHLARLWQEIEFLKKKIQALESHFNLTFKEIETKCVYEKDKK